VADERAMVNPIEIARNLREYATRGSARGTNHGANDLMAAALIEAQLAQIERLRAAGDAFAEWAVWSHHSDCGALLEDWPGVCDCGADRLRQAWEEACGD